MKYFSGYRDRKYSALYYKACEIMQISRRISDYLVPDLASLNDQGNEDNRIYFTGDIIRNSHSLIFNIQRAETEFFQDTRMQYVASVGNLTDRLYKSCERLEYVSSNGRDFLIILQKELQKFRKLQRNWKLNL
ncbi:hypothetical protein [Christiangramia sabulilitoris]|uniref:Four helix bundle protein n=1 Tax=Christiangramia sabulilitoris TaxID=2583991 RepID=A0A550HZ23_9FLAO|nr:hypothetical protein [Christiangramia sabulilitoris]TRO63984.1 hypothetical protein FGM01_10770 [Christiangramia sabulilitoris]